MALYLGEQISATSQIFNGLLRLIDFARTHIYTAATNRCFLLSGANVISFKWKSRFTSESPKNDSAPSETASVCLEVRCGMLLSNALNVNEAESKREVPSPLWNSVVTMALRPRPFSSQSVPINVPKPPPNETTEQHRRWYWPGEISSRSRKQRA